MREIKFRAWDVKEKTFHYWGFNVGNASFVGPPHDHTGRFIHQQFTGLKDKDGRKIYEGDILRGCPSGYIPEKRTPGNPVEVIFFEAQKGYTNNEVKCGWYIKENYGFVQIQVWMHVCGCGYEKVIGNIYENPELLK